MEDLWCFNDENLVRTLAQSKIPTISAIGHQTDFVLTDFVADFRAETPSAAAEWITSRYLEQLDRLDQLEQILTRIPVDILARATEKLNLLESNLKRLSPHARMERYDQQLDDLEHRLHTCTRNYFEKRMHLLDSLEQRLQANSLSNAFKRGFAYLTNEEGKLLRSVDGLIANKQVRAHLKDGSKLMEVLPDNLS